MCDSKKKGLTCRDNGVVALRISATLHQGRRVQTKKKPDPPKWVWVGEIIWWCVLVSFFTPCLIPLKVARLPLRFCLVFIFHPVPLILSLSLLWLMMCTTIVVNTHCHLIEVCEMSPTDKFALFCLVNKLG